MYVCNAKANCPQTHKWNKNGWNESALIERIL